MCTPNGCRCTRTTLGALPTFCKKPAFYKGIRERPKSLSRFLPRSRAGFWKRLETRVRRRGCASASLTTIDGRAARSPSRPQFDHLGARLAGAESVPGQHQLAPLLEQIAAPVGALDRALDPVAERLLDHLALDVRAL